MMTKEIFLSGTLSKQTIAKITIDILMLLPALYLVFLLGHWFWIVLAALCSVSLIGDIIMYFTKVHFREEHVAFHDQSGLPRKIAYDKIIGIYDSPSVTIRPMMVLSPGTIRIHYLLENGKLAESVIGMKDHDALYCELSARCPHVPFVSNELENPLFTEHYHHNPKTSLWVFVGFIVFAVVLEAALTYWAYTQHEYEAFTIPVTISLILFGSGYFIHKQIKKLNKAFCKK